MVREVLQPGKEAGLLGGMPYERFDCIGLSLYHETSNRLVLQGWDSGGRNRRELEVFMDTMHRFKPSLSYTKALTRQLLKRSTVTLQIIMLQSD